MVGFLLIGLLFGCWILLDWFCRLAFCVWVAGWFGCCLVGFALVGLCFVGFYLVGVWFTVGWLIGWLVGQFVWFAGFVFVWFMFVWLLYVHCSLGLAGCVLCLSNKLFCQ